MNKMTLTVQASPEDILRIQFSKTILIIDAIIQEEKSDRRMSPSKRVERLAEQIREQILLDIKSVSEKISVQETKKPYA